MQSLRQLLAALVFVGALLPSVARADACDFNRSFLNCLSPPVSHSIDWSFWSGTVGQLFNSETYNSCGGKEDYDQPQDVFMFICPPGQTNVTIEIFNLRCDIDLFLLHQSCSTDACVQGSVKGGKSQDSVNFTCSAGDIYTVVLERADGGLDIPIIGGLNDCDDFEEFEYSLRVHCLEDCNDRFDNDLDGLVDCLDPDCPVCHELCDDGVDNDFDKEVDCDDPDCRGAAYCCDRDFDGHLAMTGICGGDDCNDEPGVGTNIHPEAVEHPADNTDQDCDGFELCYVDNDGDFWGLPITIQSTNFTCMGPGIAAQFGDCDDANPDVNPGVGEVPVSGVDEDCDGSELCYQDVDNDHFGSDVLVLTGNLSCQGGSVADNPYDCDDNDPFAYPGAIEFPLNGVDNDCNGLELCYADLDGDGFGDPNNLVESPFVDCMGPGVAPNALDCNDLPGIGASIHPGAIEGIADGVDQNCDGQELCYHDRDDDGFGNSLQDVGFINGTDCVAAPFFDDDSLDCNDNDPFTYPGAPDPAGDGIDQNCDGLFDCFQDLDNDGWGSAVMVQATVPNCFAPGIANKTGDCNDGNPAIHPDADETPLDGIDQDCDGLEACYADYDGDGFGRALLVESPVFTCIGPGIANNKNDCNDEPAPGRGASVYPGAPEIPLNGFDDNCDGMELCYRDADADRYGRDELVPSASLDCTAHGVSQVNTDCNDNDPRINPGPSTVDTPADGIDSNCNGLEVCYIDADGDSFGRNETTESPIFSCIGPGVSKNNADCDDTRADIYPGAPPGPGSEDYSCSGTYLCYIDQDGDGFGGQGRQESSDPLCAQPGLSPNGLDCDDTNPNINPLAAEIPVDDVDQNCDGYELCWQDLDGDGHGSGTPQLSLVLTCNGDGVSRINDDCDDNPGRGETIYPGAVEVPGSGIDENCDGLERCWYDVDNDGYGASNRTPDYLTSDLDCTPPTGGPGGYAPNGDDCNDNVAAVNPGATEITANGRDEDCDGADLCFVDLDGDHYGRSTTTPDTVGDPLDCLGVGIADNSLDCYDIPPEGASIYPGAPEIPGNGFDDNCDGTELCFLDSDNDGWGSVATVTTTSLQCTVPGLSKLTGDCNDLDPAINPAATELVADGVDQDCDGTERCYQDRDLDGYGFEPVIVTSPDLSCRAPGVSPVGTDCYDVPPQGATVHPGAPEIVANGLDDNCDGKERCYLDGDFDGYGRNATGDTVALDCIAPGYSPTWDDCNDQNSAIHPGALEIPASGIDEDCDTFEVCYVDMDWDGYGRATTTLSTDFTCLSDGIAPNALDCNDVPPEGQFIYPGAPEVPGDGIDQDCNNAEACYYDADGDGFGSIVAPGQFPSFDCYAPNAARIDGDCDDNNPNIYPGAPEIVANGIDENCDGREACYQDIDRDRFGNPNQIVASADMDCDDPGESSNGDDCLDSGSVNGTNGPVVASAIHPNAKEICNGVDDDCDGWIDDEDSNLVATTYWYPDNDRDGFGNPAIEVAACLAPDGGWTDLPYDCNDNNPEINPLAQEVCDPFDVDENCNGRADDADVDANGNPLAVGAVLVHPDVDRDGYGDASASLATCDPPAGYVLDGTDCLDTEPAVNPGRPEIVYDGLDNDCDPNTKDDDLDGDGYTKRLHGDCNDNPVVGLHIHPGAVELPNGIDDNCNGKVDEGTIWYDDDGDGFTEAGGDCNDADPTIYPGAPEGRFVAGQGIVGDNKDNDCDGIVDEGTNRYDDDGDGWNEIQGDCNDGDPNVHPGRTEIMDNGIDDDCDGSVDGGAFDEDRDGYTELGGDCDPKNPNVHPGARELPNGIDDDCDGLIDEGTSRYDDDGDGFSEEQGDCNDVPTDVSPPPPGSGPTVHPGAEDIPNGIDDDCDGIIDEGSDASDDDRDGFSELQGDCDDTNPAIKPGAVELPNGIDDDCDGEIDEGLEDRDRDGYTADEDCDDNNGWANPGQPEVCDGIDNDCVNGVDIDANGRNVCDGMMLPPQCSGGCNEDCDGDGKADNGCSAAGSRGHQRLAIALIGLVGALLRRRRAAA